MTTQEPVMAGLVPAIHVFLKSKNSSFGWCFVHRTDRRYVELRNMTFWRLLKSRVV
jgi:hypothetical protein